MEQTDGNFWIMVGGVIASLAVGIFGVIRGQQDIKKASPEATEISLKAVGLELGNRQQTQDMVDALNRIADIMENKKHSETDQKLNELLRRADMQERREEQEESSRRPEIPPRRR